MPRMLGIFCLFIAATTAQAQETPAFVLRVRSLDQLIDNAQLIAKAVGKSDILKQYEGLVKSKVGRDGLAGIDPAKPIGFYLHVGKDVNDFRGAALIPIKDEKAFLDIFKSFNLTVTKGKDDIYTVSTGTLLDFYLQFDGKYAHVTALNMLALDAKNRLSPAKLLGPDGGPVLSMRLRVDQIPVDAKILFKGHVEDSMEKAQSNIRMETAAQKAFRQALNKEILQTVEMVLQEAQEINLQIDLKDGKDVSLDVNVVGAKGTELTKKIEALAQQPSLFGGQRGQKAAIGVGLHILAAKDVREPFVQVIQEAKNTALASIQNDEKKKQAEQLFAKLLPTLESGDLDVAGRITGPKGGEYSGVLVVKLEKGTELGDTVQSLITDMLKSMPEEKKKIVQLDAEKVGAIAIHKFTLPKNPFNPRWGEDAAPTALSLAFAGDRMVVGVGDDGTAMVKDVLANNKASAAPVFEVAFDMGALAPLIAPTDDLRTMARKLFPNEEEGKVRIRIEGGSTLRLTVTTRLAVLQFLSQERKMEVKVN